MATNEWNCLFSWSGGSWKFEQSRRHCRDKTTHLSVLRRGSRKEGPYVSGPEGKRNGEGCIRRWVGADIYCLSKKDAISSLKRCVEFELSKWALPAQISSIYAEPHCVQFFSSFSNLYTSKWMSFLFPSQSIWLKASREIEDPINRMNKHLAKQCNWFWLWLHFP